MQRLPGALLSRRTAKLPTTLTEFSPSPERFSFIGLPPGYNQDASAIPIPAAQISFRVYGGTIAAAAGAADQSFRIHCLLREGYAYILNDVSMYLTDAEAGDIADWGTKVTAYTSNVADGETGESPWLAGVPMEGINVINGSTALGAGIYTPARIPQNIIIPNSANAELHLNMFNAQTDGGPITLYLLATFLEFSIQQAHHWAINTPWPVR